MEIMLRINREGSFETGSDTDNQCGKIGQRQYKYFITIEASNKALTPEGYVMENAWCDNYFRDRYERQHMPCGSCEEMAQAAVKYFVSLFRDHPDLQPVDLRRVYVRIHGSTWSFIEAEWSKK